MHNLGKARKANHHFSSTYLKEIDSRRQVVGSKKEGRRCLAFLCYS